METSTRSRCTIRRPESCWPRDPRSAAPTFVRLEIDSPRRTTRPHSINYGFLCEDRYLHQTGTLTPKGEFQLAEDLPIVRETDFLQNHNPRRSPPTVGSLPFPRARFFRRVRVTQNHHARIFKENIHAIISSCPNTKQERDETDSRALESSGTSEIETYACRCCPYFDCERAKLAIYSDMTRNNRPCPGISRPEFDISIR